MRTILLADAGGTAMPELRRRLDAALREQLAAAGGQLIDQSDGLLALFERPVQAVDFALRYLDILREVAAEAGLERSARIGIHVGEVVTWENPAAAVAQGAKPLEVEGLAKPVAARLMNLALPGQILLSGIAQSLARRAQAELGARADKLRWCLHGRYRFKGVTTPMVVHEVGERGIAPLRAPPAGEKGWRELPLWRRPPVLAIEVLGTATLLAGVGYSLLRSEPALSFGQRDWVVVGDFRNFTGDPRLGEALDTALRVSLEQSRYLNLLPELKVESTLAQMRRPATTVVDRTVGSEIALRAGARALLLPSVTQVDGRLRVNVEVVDPVNRVTVYAESADGTGADSALHSLDRVNAALRARLGEAVPDIAANGKPLAQVTTANLAALEDYTLAVKARDQSRYADALHLAQAAVRRDPEFALAYTQLWRNYDSNGQDELAAAALARAQELRPRLTLREQVFLDATVASSVSPTRSMQSWKLLADLYPDEYIAYYAYAQRAWNGAQRYGEGARFLRGALGAHSSIRANAYYLLGVLELAQDQLPEAQRAFATAESLGVRGLKIDQAMSFAAQRNFAAARAAAATQTITGGAENDLVEHDVDYLLDLDQGHWRDAYSRLKEQQARARKVSTSAGRVYSDRALLLRLGIGEVPAQAQLAESVAQSTAAMRDALPDARTYACYSGLAVGLFAARAGDLALARRALRDLGAGANDSDFAALRSIATMLQAELDIAEGRPSAAIGRLRARQDGTELYFSHEVLARAWSAAGNSADALRESDWLASHRGRAFGEWGRVGLLSPLNVAESNLAWLDGAEFAYAARDSNGARRRLDMFESIWPRRDWPGPVRSRVLALEGQLPRKTATHLAASLASAR